MLRPAGLLRRQSVTGSSSSGSASSCSQLVAGLGWSTWLFLRRRMAEQHYETYKIRIGRSLLLGLEVVVAADIVRTIATAPTLLSIGVLAGLVLIRTFLSWTLVLEIEGRWPWQRGSDHLQSPVRRVAPDSDRAIDPVES
jgi:uncharacterized membrane protein